MKGNPWKYARYLARSGVLAMSVALSACGDHVRDMDAMSSCSESNEEQVASPGGKYVATVFRRNCGATTGFVTHVNLRLGSEPDRVEESGTVLQGQVLVANGTPSIQVRWIDGTSLSLQVSDRSKVVSTQESWKTIRIKSNN